MSDILNKEAVRHRTGRQRRAWWKRVVRVLSCVVVFCTVYALVLKAITLGDMPVCGMEEHTHTEQCSRTHVMTSVCPAVDTVVLHTHDDQCYDSDGSLWCPLQERTEHLHGADCFEDVSELVCPLDEIEPHFHDESCLGQISVISCNLGDAHVHSSECFQQVKMLSCEQHVHGEGCYGEAVLVCGDLEHEHDESCYTPGELLCQEPEHVHGDECYTPMEVQVCDTQDHVHDESCYTLTDGYICGREETEGHTHTEQCYELRTHTVCGLEQIAVHTHDEGCLDENENVICGIISAEEHIHDENCAVLTVLPEPELLCAIPEHVHTDSCYPQEELLPEQKPGFLCEMGEHIHGEGCVDENGELACTLMEHIHTAPCLVKDYDGNADVESAADWEASLSGVTLTGNYAQDILAVAKSQVGYQESSRNVWLCADGSLKGYTRYGGWYGIPYGDWCAMFVSFCVHYAGATDVPLDSLCNTYIEQLTQAEMYRLPGEYAPKPGDLVFMDWERTGGEITDVDHMGIVAEIVTDENGAPVQLVTIEGNWDNVVQYRTHDYASPTIVGYGEMPVGDGRVLACEESHAHGDGCYGWQIAFENETVQGNMVITGLESLPEDLIVSVETVTEDDGMTYGAMNAAVELEMEQTPWYVGDVKLFCVTMTTAEGEYTLPEGARGVLVLEFREAVFEEAAVAAGSGLKTFFLAEGDPISLMDGTLIDTYQAEESLTTGYENAAQGLTGLRLELEDQRQFAVVLSSSSLEGQFWTRVTDKSQLTAGTYMIVSAQGHAALLGSGTDYYSPVVLATVKGRTEYYTITPRSGELSKNFYWTITPSGNGYIVQNQQQSNYLYVNRVREGWFNVDKVIHSSTATLTFTYDAEQKSWTIKNGSYYLRNDDGKGFDIHSTSSPGINHDMLIFKLADVTSLSVPDDYVPAVVDKEKGPDKPDYPAFIEPTQELDGKTALEKGNVKVQGHYYSDKSTSDIEKFFDMDDYAENYKNDGMIRTDKSVIYGGDDYGAFDSYAPNTFGVTLSVLGQEYEMPYEDNVRTPIDVVFVLDVSGSMSSNETGSSSQRAEDMVAATNTAIKAILDDHKDSRVGVVLYATGAWKLLPLGRYKANGDNYLIINARNTTQNNASRQVSYVQTAASLTDDDGNSYANLGGPNFNQGWGTYTQAGIALGYETFQAVTDTSYTTWFGEGESKREYTVQRQPVYILLSDGEPTHGSPIYMDPVAGPHYGDGKANAENAKGVIGFDTVLSANYFKRMTSIHYQNETLFFTVGMGISDVNAKPHISTSNTTDAYKRAVLNPTPENIAALSLSYTDPDGTKVSGNQDVDIQLKQLLEGNFSTSTHTTTVLSQWPDNWTGDPHTIYPLRHTNPYAGDYSYADGAYFNVVNEADLQKIFAQIVEASLRETPYGFILHKSSSMEITDRIGEGMEIKGLPILRYQGVNYEVSEVIKTDGDTRYIYKGIVDYPYITDPNSDLAKHKFDLEDIVVRSYYNENGHQVISMYIPDAALPVYSPELIAKKFYYEMLPVRLIYQVGLTAESEKAVMDLYKTGGELVFYTNVWEDEGEQSIANLYPSLENPFYFKILEETGHTRYHEHTIDKETGANVTDTLSYVVDCSKRPDTVNGEQITKVFHKLGNNGKLTFSVPNVDIPVEKIWGAKPDEGLVLEVDIYNVQLTDTGKEEPTLAKTISLTEENGWAGVFENMPILTSGYYAIVERIPEGYQPQYSGQTKTLVIDNKETLVAVVDLSNTETVPVTVITNQIKVILPATGGIGTIPIYICGLSLMAAAVYIFGIGRLRRKGGQ